MDGQQRAEIKEEVGREREQWRRWWVRRGGEGALALIFFSQISWSTWTKAMPGFTVSFKTCPKFSAPVFSKFCFFNFSWNILISHDPFSLVIGSPLFPHLNPANTPIEGGGRKASLYLPHHLAQSRFRSSSWSRAPSPLLWLLNSFLLLFSLFVLVLIFSFVTFSYSNSFFFVFLLLLFSCLLSLFPPFDFPFPPFFALCFLCSAALPAVLEKTQVIPFSFNFTFILLILLIIQPFLILSSSFC